MNDVSLHIYTHEFFPKRGGIGVYCHEFAKAAAEIGCHVTVHAPKSARPAEPNVGYILCNGKAAQSHDWWSLWQTRRKLRQQLKAFPHDLHLFAESTPILALGTLPKDDIRSFRCLITLHGSEIIRWKKASLTRLIACRAIRGACGVRTVALPMAHMAKHAFPDSSDKIHAVLNALPSKHLKALKEGETFDRPSGIELELLSVGRIHRRKGYENIINALGQLPRKVRRGIRFTIAGARQNKRYLRELENLARKNEVVLKLELDISDQRLAQCYQSSDLFALTSVYRKNSIEGFGLVYLEAGAYRIPCIGYRTGGVSDAIRDGETGFLIEPGNITALAQAIQRIFDSPELRRQMGDNNYAFATSRDWTDVVKETLRGIV